jgi:hypothetical protein
LAPPCFRITALNSVKLIIVKDVDSVPKSSVGCCIEKYDTITKITKTASLGKLKIVQNVANPDTEIRLGGRIHPVLFG